MKIHLLSDNSGYLIIAKDVINRLYIWKYKSPTLTCQTSSILQSFAQGQLKLSDSKLFFFETDSAYTLHFCQITFGNSAADWSKKMTCPSGTCSAGLSESLLSSDSSTIYSLFAYGSTRYLYFTSFRSSDGSVLGTRYKSSISIHCCTKM